MCLPGSCKGSSSSAAVDDEMHLMDLNRLIRSLSVPALRLKPFWTNGDRDFCPSMVPNLVRE